MPLQVSTDIGRCGPPQGVEFKLGLRGVESRTTMFEQYIPVQNAAQVSGAQLAQSRMERGLDV